MSDEPDQTASAVGLEPVPVSVVIPAYNRPEMVARAVRSALGQVPRPPREVIVVDDCSTDNTGAAAARAGAQVVRHEVNKGEGPARNTGIAHAREPWVALLDSDDEWLPSLLATLWPLRDGHVLVGGASLNCPPEPEPPRYAGVLARRPVVLSSPSALIYPENFVAASGTLVRRETMTAVGGYRPLKGGADLDLWIRALERGTGLIVPQPVVVYHVHAGQITSNAAMMSDAHGAVARLYAGRPWWRDAALARWAGGAGYDASRREWAAGRRWNAIRHAAGVLRSPTRTAGAVGILLRRARLRRRSALVDRNGRPSVALLPGTAESLNGTRDLRDMSTSAALARLALQPTQRAVAGSRRQAVAARLIGVAQVTRG